MKLVCSNAYPALCMLACTFALSAAGCAKAVDPPGNGQSHWLRPCESDADCGDLSCECGVCTILCASDSTCSARAGLSCRSAALLATADECEDDPSETLLCLDEELAPEADAAQPDADADAETPDAQVDPMDDAAIVDARVADATDNDAVVEEIDAGPPPIYEGALYIDCDLIADEALPPELEVVGVSSSQNLGRLTASGADVAWASLGGIHYRLGDAPAETLLDLVGLPTLRDGELFFAERGGGISKRVLASGEVLELAREPAAEDMWTLTVASDAVYWAATDSSDSAIARIFRSPREPGGETKELAAFRYDGDAPPLAFAAIGEYVYFPRGVGGGNTIYQIARAPIDGSGDAEPLGDPIENFSNLVTDGQSLFGTISGVDSSEGPPPDDHRIVRIEEDGTPTTLHMVDKVWWYPGYDIMQVDDTYLYWMGYPGASDGERAIWRARKDGEGTPEMLIAGIPDVAAEIALGDGWLNIVLGCTQGHVLRMRTPA